MPPTRTASRSVPARAPAARPIVIREGGARRVAGQLARRAGSAAVQAARDESHTLAAVVAAGALGYARREGMLDNIPSIDAIGAEGTLALVAFAAGKFMRSKMASHVATGLASVAINRMAAGDLGGGTSS